MTTAIASPSHNSAESHADHAEHPPFLAHHFESPQQQFDSGKLGMWIFLVTEVLFFSGLFCAYAVYRANHPEIFIYAHQFLDKTLGAINTGVLIFSSLTMAWAVRCSQLGQRRGLMACLAITLVCAGIFLVIKYFEYAHKIHEGLLWAGRFEPVAHAGSAGHAAEAPRNAGIFFSIYYCMTGLHAVHILGGMGAITWLLVRAWKDHFSPQYFGPVDYVGLYWHLVDLVWIYLFPLLYLIH